MFDKSSQEYKEVNSDDSDNVKLCVAVPVDDEMQCADDDVKILYALDDINLQDAVSESNDNDAIKDGVLQVSSAKASGDDSAALYDDDMALKSGTYLV